MTAMSANEIKQFWIGEHHPDRLPQNEDIFDHFVAERDFPAAMAHISSFLRFARVDLLVIEFNGEGDSGCVELYIRTPSPVASTKGLQDYLRDKLAECCDWLMDQLAGGGWAINDGSFGEISFDVITHNVTSEINERIVDVNTTCHDMPVAQVGAPVSAAEHVTVENLRVELSVEEPLPPPIPPIMRQPTYKSRRVELED